MNKFNQEKNNKKNSLIFLIAALTLLIGCSGTWGKYKRSDEVTKIYETYQVLPDYNYYYTGSNVRPDAVMGIQKNYTLTSADLWIAVNLDSKQLKFWVEDIKKDPSYQPDGYFILDDKGKQIGTYYTRWDTGPVKMQGEKQVEVYLPDKDTYKRGPSPSR